MPDEDIKNMPLHLKQDEENLFMGSKPEEGCSKKAFLEA